MGRGTDRPARPTGRRADHAYGVALEIETHRGAQMGAATFRPFCDCGWRSRLVFLDQRDAAAAAFRHATGRYPEPGPETPPRHRGPKQSEALFDGSTYER